MRLVYLSPVPWESFAQRPHKFVEWFHSRCGEPVLWIDPYPTRFPQWGDLRRIIQPIVSRGLSNNPPWLTVLKPGGLPIEPIPGSTLVNRFFWRRIFRKVNDFAGDHDLLLGIGKPSALAVMFLNRYCRSMSLYDAMDDFPAFYSGFSKIALARHEVEIGRRTSVIWASSTELKVKWGRQRNDVCLVRNALDPGVLPNTCIESAALSRKVFGYVGTIASWFDWNWLKALAEARPNDLIRLIGPIFQMPSWALPENIELKPACHHATALKSMAEFDVGLIPFKKNALTASVDPIKYYEYMAIGIPVLSTAFGEMDFRADVQGVFICRAVDDIAVLAEAALHVKKNAARAQDFAEKNSWTFRFDAAELMPCSNAMVDRFVSDAE
jgi:hypothetical protein